MLRPQDPPVVPEDTRCVACAAFPKGTLRLRIADALGPVYQDGQFTTLFPSHGQPAATPCGAGSTGRMRSAWRSLIPASTTRC